MYKHFFLVFLLCGFFIGCNTDDDRQMEYNKTINTDENERDNSSSNNEEKNLLKNGGMESWLNILPVSYDTMQGWSLNHSNNVKRDNIIVYEGKFSARLKSEENGSTATVSQLIAVEPNHKIRIKFHYYVEQWKTNGARTYCYFRTNAAEKYNISIADLRAVYDKNEYYIIRGGGYGLTYLPHNLNQWLLFDEIIEVPKSATYFLFGINSYYGTTIYVDDCYVIDVTDNSTK